MEETALQAEIVDETPLTEDELRVYAVRRAALVLAIIAVFAGIYIAIRKTLDVESRATRSVVAMLSSRARGRAFATDFIYQRFENGVSKAGWQDLADAAKGNRGPGVRAHNVEVLLRYSRDVRRMAQDAVPQAEAEGFAPLTFFQSPGERLRIPLNATSDGRMDPDAVKAVMARQADIGFLMAVARDRAQQRLPKERALFLALSIRRSIDGNGAAAGRGE